MFDNICSRWLNKSVWLKIILVLAVVGIFMLMFWVNSKMKTVSQPLAVSSEASQNDQSLIATYRGMLPCADCSGLDTTLELYQGIQNKLPTMYKMTSIYTGKNVAPLVESGSWSIIGGVGAYRTASIYQLKQQSGSMQNFVKQSDTLELIDNDFNRLPGSVSTVLKLVN